MDGINDSQNGTTPGIAALSASPLKPYYHDERSNITLYCGDCRVLLPEFKGGSFDAVIVDPVWPNCLQALAGSDDPAGLFAGAAQHFPRLAKRVVVQLGCDSDPRFLLGMPAEMPFFRVCWLDYAMPTYKGRLLYSGDVAYAFGVPPPSRDGHNVVPGRMTSTRPDGRQMRGEGGRKKNYTRTGAVRTHPSPRRLDHVSWLVKWFADGPILDPFAGAGTTLLAAKLAGYPAIGVEIEERFCERAAKRLDNVPANLFYVEA